MSVVRATPIGAAVSTANAILITLTLWHSLGGAALVAWCAGTCTTSLLVFRMSWRVRNVVVGRVSPRAARRLLMTSLFLAFPWGILGFWASQAGDVTDRLVALIVCSGMITGASLMLQRTLLAAIVYIMTVNIGVILGCLVGRVDEASTIIFFDLLFSYFVAYSASLAGGTARDRDRTLVELSDTHGKLEKAYAKISSMALVDPVTGLANRAAFMEKVDEVAARAQQDRTRRVVCLLDLDHFKNVNDSFGHHVGDELLAITGRRIAALLGTEGTVARLGGDEFAVIARLGGRFGTPGAVAEAILDAVAEPAEIADRVLLPGTSVGLAVLPDDSSTASELLHQADAALGRSKEAGRGRWGAFDRMLGSQIENHKLMTEALKTALETNTLSVHYQPKIDLARGGMAGAEALVRWNHPTLGNVPPDKFLPVAMDAGLIQQLSDYIFSRVADDVLQWRAEDIKVGRIAVNIHPFDLKAPHHLMAVLRKQMACGVGPDDIALEITEGCFVGRGTETAPMVLDAIADMGYVLSLDDFGTGHAALTHLRSLPVSEIKIDKSFVANIVSAKSDRAIVEATIAIARGMGLTSVAEGIETLEQLEMLHHLGADFGQGFYWSRPLRPEAMPAFVAGLEVRLAKGGDHAARSVKSGRTAS